MAVWLIALLIALVATVQLRSQAEVERSLVQADPATLAFSIDQLSRANDELEAQIAELNQQRSALQSGGNSAADQALEAEQRQLRIAEGLVPVHGPGVVLVVDASGLTALDLQDAMNNLAAGGGEALAVNDQRVVAGVPIVQTAAGVTVGGVLTPAPWTILAIGDTNRLADTADLMTQQLRGDRRVRQATYRVESDIVIRAVVSERPFVYAVP
ncbi:MAG TPA: DUF881 domain-containing protein [Candidatus Dormibacteraeota bacterium]|nr:DUF881 domain-containing protein [Candidatus Dormibacteraeota bacterium]